MIHEMTFSGAVAKPQDLRRHRKAPGGGEVKLLQSKGPGGKIRCRRRVAGRLISVKKLFLLDGMALVYRAHFALIARPIFNSKGVNTSALYGFTQTLLDILSRQEPTHIAVAFDPDKPTQRHRD